MPDLAASTSTFPRSADRLRRRLRDLALVGIAFAIVLATTLFARADAPRSAVDRDPARSIHRAAAVEWTSHCGDRPAIGSSRRG